MPGLGIYTPDATEGITRVEDLPAPRVIERSRNYASRPCPRRRQRRPPAHGPADAARPGRPIGGHPRDLHLTYSQHRRRECDHYFNADMLDLAVPNVTSASLSPGPRSKTGSRRRGKKGERRVEREYLDEALAKFSGYIAVDELYDGPFCVLSLVEHRHRFVARHRTPGRQRTLARITRGLPQLRVLREIMDQVYGLFDRRCRSETALEKLAQLRRRVKRFKEVGKTLAKLYSPNLEKALTFLDDKLLPSTSNGVERGNRRHRKMQKSMYRVRTQRSLRQRMALDLLREMQADGRCRAGHALHRNRSPRRFRAESAVASVTVL